MTNQKDWQIEFDEQFKPDGWHNGWSTPDPEDVKAFISKVEKEARDRREAELYIVAEEMAAKGWDFNKYLFFWAKLMQERNPLIRKD